MTTSKEIKKGLLLDSLGNAWAVIKTDKKSITVCDCVSSDGVQFINQRTRKVTHNQKKVAKFEAQDQEGLTCKKVYSYGNTEIYTVR